MQYVPLKYGLLMNDVLTMIARLTLPITKPFGTHTVYQGGWGGGGGRPDPTISKTVVPMNIKCFMVLETSLKVLEM